MDNESQSLDYDTFVEKMNSIYKTFTVSEKKELLNFARKSTKTLSNDSLKFSFKVLFAKSYSQIYYQNHED